jgi:DNA-binding LacI/PurR family transcriptional regulator
MQACTTPPEELASLVRRRQVQGILLPCGNASILGWLQQLAVPFATISSANWLRQRVRFDMCQFIALAIAELAARGCRSAGMISAVPLHDVNPDGSEHELLAFWRTFARLMRSHGLAWREEWVIAADGPLARPAEDQARFGYRAMRHLWRQPARPEGLIVYTDALTPGVVAALLQDSVPVPRDLQLALHHCPETPLLCPLPAAYLEADLAAVATGLLDLLQRQLAGQPVEPVTIPFVLRHHTPEE